MSFADADSSQEVLLLADEFVERCRRGERPTVEEYTSRHPELADAIRHYFPMMATMEDIVVADDDGSVKHTSDTSIADLTRTSARSGLRTAVELPEQFGRYRVSRMLGQGEMGTVFLARDTQLDRDVALKIPRFDRDDTQAIERFHREARAMATVHHPNLCPVFDVGEIDGRHFLTMGYVDGPTLSERIKAGPRLSDPDAADLVRKLATALQVAHNAGIVHRDLKPSNVMLDAQGEPIIMDFGLARRQREGEETLTHEGVAVGTPVYMSPEQVEGLADQIGPRSDVYALGVMLYELLCGRRPFEGSVMKVLGLIVSTDPPALRSLRADVDDKLEAICAKAMAKSLDDRFQSATELADALATVAADPDLASGAHSDLATPERSTAADAMQLQRGNSGRTILARKSRTRWQVWLGAVALASLAGFVLSRIPATSRDDNVPPAQSESPAPRIAAAPVEPVSPSSLLPPTPQATARSSAQFTPLGEPIGGRVRAVGLGDLDGDGDLDAFLARHRATLKVMLNDGAGVFSDGPPIADPDEWRNWELALGDVDADGDLDAFVTRNGRDKLWLNDGHAQFTLSDEDFGEAESNQPAFGDLDDDGDLDLVVPQKGQCRVWFNDGNGHFTGDEQRFCDEYYCACGLGDLDGDGDLDAFIGTVGSSPARVWINDGHGTFEDSGQSIGESSAWDVKLVDWDDDGDLDALVANHDAPTELWINNGAGDFSLGQQAPEAYKSSAVCVADLDGDGDLDVFESNNGDGAPELVWRTDGATLFAGKTSLPEMDGERCAVGDLDADGDLDIFADRVWLNRDVGRLTQAGLPLPEPVPTVTSTGEFHDSGERLGDSPSDSVLLGDLDGDGDLDAFVGCTDDHPDVVWINDGSGHFHDSGQRLGEHVTFGLSLGDIDGDGDLDALAGEAGPPTRVWLNDGSGRFTPGDPLPRCHHPALADLDGDGDLDVFLSCHGPPRRNLVLFNDGFGRFTDSQQELGSAISLFGEPGDIDNDGDVDVYVCNATGFHDVLYLNDGDGRFTASLQRFDRAHSRMAELIDWDNDGLRDILVCVWDDRQQLWLNRGQNEFVLRDLQEDGLHYNWFVAADIDGDSNQEVVTVSSTVSSNGLAGPAGVFRREPGGASARMQRFGLMTGAGVDAGDLDRDGDLDLYIANGNHAPDQVWLNRNAGQPALSVRLPPPPVPSVETAGRLVDSGQRLGNSVSNVVCLGDLDGDDDLDAFVGCSSGGAADFVWINDGTGAFRDSGQRLGGFPTSGVSLGDIDDDGDLDVVAAQSSSRSQVWRNEGDGTFARDRQRLNPAAQLALGDLDGDDDLDVFVARGGPCGVLWNDGSGTFTDSGQNLGAADSRHVALGDVDGDGDLDSFVSNFGPDILYLNDGHGRFAPAEQAFSESYSRMARLIDWSGDGRLDIVVCIYGEEVEFWINQGRNVFARESRLEVVGIFAGFASGDLDGDSDLDLIVSGEDTYAVRNGQSPPANIEPFGLMTGSACDIGDLDGDGDLDVFFANFGNQPDLVWFNGNTTDPGDPPVVEPAPPVVEPAPSFVETSVTFGTDDVRWAVAVADFDGDDDPDVFAPGSAAPGRLWLQNDAGMLEDSGQELLHDFTSWISAGDLDGDGDVDVFASAHGRSDAVWLNDGSGEFQRSTQQFAPMLSRINVLVDVDEDDDLDVVVAVQHSNDLVWLNDGQANFTQSIELPGTGSYGVAAGDIDNDGDQDLVFSTFREQGPLRIWLNDGRGGFDRLRTSITAPGSHGVALVDLNGDGFVDLAVGGQEPDAATRIFFGSGDGAFHGGTVTLAVTTAIAIAHGDVDGDGDIDLVTGNQNRINELLLNDGKGGFKSGQKVGGTQNAAHLADFDGDGDLDIINADGSIWLNQTPTAAGASGTAVSLRPPPPVPTAQSTGEFEDSGHELGNADSVGVALGDLDGDGDLDAFVGNARQSDFDDPDARQPNRVWINDGNAGFSDSGQELGLDDTALVELGDLDGDGDLEAIAANMTSPSVTWVNDGRGLFHPGQRFEVGRCHHVAPADLDADGDLDLVFSCDGASNQVWLNDGQGRFADSKQRLGRAKSLFIQTGDVDGDGDPDLFVCNGGEPDTVWLNDGSGTFTDTRQQLASGHSRTADLIDVDADGDLDAVVSACQGPVVLWTNDGDGRFRIGEISNVASAWNSHHMADMDGDGDLDVVVAGGHGSGGPSCIFRNNGDGRLFTEPVFFSDGFAMGCAPGDLDGDGDIDLFQINMQGQPNRVWLNRNPDE